MKLTNLLNKLDLGLEKPVYVAASNIDDIFFALNDLGVKEIEVTKTEMNIIVMFYLANNGDKDPEKPKILKEGTVDKFLGVKIVLMA